MAQQSRTSLKPRPTVQLFLCSREASLSLLSGTRCHVGRPEGHASLRKPLSLLRAAAVPRRQGEGSWPRQSPPPGPSLAPLFAPHTQATGTCSCQLRNLHLSQAPLQDRGVWWDRVLPGVQGLQLTCRGEAHAGEGTALGTPVTGGTGGAKPPPPTAQEKPAQGQRQRARCWSSPSRPHSTGGPRWGGGPGMGRQWPSGPLPEPRAPHPSAPHLICTVRGSSPALLCPGHEGLLGR